MPTLESPTEKNVADIPLYTGLDAARYLRVPVWFALSFLSRRSHHPMELLERFWRNPRSRVQFADDYGPTLRGESPERITFRSLASLFVASPLLRAMVHDASLPLPHPEALHVIFDVGHDFAFSALDNPLLFTDADWVLSRFDRVRAPDMDRGHLLKLIVLHQARLEMNEGTPARLFPFSRDPSPNAPRSVVIDPEIRFGRPTLKGVPTDVLAERWRAGDSAADLADDYGLTADETEEALRYEASPSPPLFLFPFPAFGW